MGPLLVAFVAAMWLAFRMFGQNLAPASEGLLKVALWVLPSVLVVRATGSRNWSGMLGALGLRGSPSGGLLFGIVATLPVLVLVIVRLAEVSTLAYALPFQVARVIRGWNAVTGNVILGPFAEEVLFRGLVIYMLAKLGGWRDLPVIVASGALFGLAHFGNAEPAQIPGIAFGGALFAWIALRRGTIWPAIGLHACLNLWWDFFPTQAELGTVPSMLVAAVVTIALARRQRSLGTEAVPLATRGLRLTSDGEP